MARKSFFVSAGPQADRLRDLPIELSPEGHGVGPWVPKEKHKLLAEYLYATRLAWKKWPRRVFIDPFCGPATPYPT